MLIAYWHHFKGLEAEAIVTIAPVRDDAGERVNRHVVRSRAKRLLAVIEVQKRPAFTQKNT